MAPREDAVRIRPQRSIFEPRVSDQERAGQLSTQVLKTHGPRLFRRCVSLYPPGFTTLIPSR